jgi:hypothetical protein
VLYADVTRADGGANPVMLVADGNPPGEVVVPVAPAAAPVSGSVAGVVVDIVEMVSVADEQSATVRFVNKGGRVCPLPLVKL